MVEQTQKGLSKMSEGEIASLRAEIRNLSEKSDRQHAANIQSQQLDREAFRSALQTQQQTFSLAMEAQRTAFQDALNKQYQLHTTLDKVVERHAILIENCIGDGQPGEGRVGVLETSMETMKKFRWQALTIVAFMMWGIEVWRHGSGH